MVLTEDGERYMRHLSWELEAVDVIVHLERHGPHRRVSSKCDLS